MKKQIEELTYSDKTSNDSLNKRVENVKEKCVLWRYIKQNCCYININCSSINYESSDTVLWWRIILYKDLLYQLWIWQWWYCCSKLLNHANKFHSNAVAKHEVIVSNIVLIFFANLFSEDIGAKKRLQEEINEDKNDKDHTVLWFNGAGKPLWKE